MRIGISGQALGDTGRLFGRQATIGLQSKPHLHTGGNGRRAPFLLLKKAEKEDIVDNGL